MDKDQNELEELTREIGRIIADNRKFLARVMDDDFEPEEEAGDGDDVVVEEL